ncbi:leucyl aminopeptidase [Encephalitozoon hellem ATCC 50504]|uniref:Cytosol aminopeptidase n=1 Tax=Encephalitozoon hellem TaxID=27973 RepID=A0A9Q9C4Y5_ENCHE|nr:leucyl aminopeptidase [Encephalitozoon hellem ATCC 50504]AFM99273.1 leucyl aminopeptidase [Encephalitozoon hellem ATCC 50504]UTX44261.1 cytosol aminopeptidase [Encephalitozoon hellem]|eukprot:XP_003888254.1 leucyl aminopeptidase [Encephalitozoon hellem ATCC 50504]
MGLINYEKLMVMSGADPDSTKVRIVLCSNTEEGVSIVADEKSSAHEEFLSSLGAKGNLGESHVLPEGNGRITVFVGIGKVDENILIAKNNARKAGASGYKAVSQFRNIEVSLGSEFMAREVVSGIILASYKYQFLNKEGEEPKKIVINSDLEMARKATIVGNAQNFARFLGDTPANLMNPTLFTEYATKYLDGKRNVTVDVFDREFMKSKSMNLLLSVSQGSTQEPKLFVAKYRGKGGEGVDLALVGKGVCFDSGGISLKPSGRMCRMKGDMLGGASVLSAFGVIADMGVKMNVDLVIPLVENLPSGTATKPGDVYVGMNGKSVEIDNTDAEGRLILADALVYAQESKPTYIFDVATLTGAMSVALGDAFIGYFTADDNLSEIIYRSGIDSNDPTWRMPLSQLYLPAMKSDVADLKNTGAGRYGGSSSAAIFLNEFINKESKWVHFDIAGVMESNNNKGVYGEGMTGCSVPVLVETIERLSGITN